MKKWVSNESGLTLIELLATIVIGSIVIGLATSVFVSAAKQNKIVYEHNSLRQEANLIITKLRQIHQDQSYTLCYETNNKLYLDNTITNSIGQKDYTFDSVMIENGNTKIQNAGSCIENVNIDAPLLIQFTLLNNSGQEFNINTAIHRIKPLKTVATSPEEFPSGGSQESFKNIVDEQQHLYPNVMDINRCNFPEIKGNVRISSHYNYPPNQGNCQNNNILNGSILLNGITIAQNWQLIINQTLYNKKQTKLENNSGLTVFQNAKLDEAVQLYNKSSLYIGKKLHALDAVSLASDSDIYVGQSALFEKNLTLSSSSDVHIEGNLYAKNNLVIGDNADIYVAGNSNIDGVIELKNNSVYITDNNLIAKNKVKLSPGAILTIGGNANFHSIELTGGRICVEGSAEYTVYPSYQVITTAASCEKQPENTIYVLNK